MVLNWFSVCFLLCCASFTAKTCVLFPVEPLHCVSCSYKGSVVNSSKKFFFKFFFLLCNILPGSPLLFGFGNLVKKGFFTRFRNLVKKVFVFTMFQTLVKKVFVLLGYQAATLPTCGPPLILPPALKRWGPPRRQGLCGHLAHLWATCDSAPRSEEVGTPQAAGVM